MRGSLPISLLAATVLTGCASVAIDENFAEVERFAREQTGSEVRWLRSDPEREAMRAEVDRLLAQPLAIDHAVRIALGYSPALQSLLAEAAGWGAAYNVSINLSGVEDQTFVARCRREVQSALEEIGTRAREIREKLRKDLEMA